MGWRCCIGRNGVDPETSAQIFILDVVPVFAGEGDNVTLMCDVCMNPWGQFTVDL